MVKAIVTYSGLTKARLAILIVAMGLIFVYATWLAQSSYFYHNEGVSLRCSEYSVLDLIHPGKPQTFPCSYDHQPLYLLLLKAWNSVFPVDPLISRLPSVLLVTFSIGLFGLWAGTFELSTTLWSLAVLIFATTPYLLELNIQVRLYGLLMFQTLLALWTGRLYAEQLIRPRWFFIIAYFGLYNFYLFPFLTLIQLYCYRSTERPLLKKEILIPTIGIVLLSLVKTPYVFWWRLIERTGGDWSTTSAAVKEFFILPFFPQNGFWPYTITSFFLAMGFIGVWINKNLPSREKLLHCLLFALSLLLILILHFAFRSNELTPRYFLFYWPLLILHALFLIQNWIRDERRNHLLACAFLAVLPLVNLIYVHQRPSFGEGHQNPSMNFELANSARPYLKKGEKIWVTSNVSWILSYYILPYLEVANGKVFQEFRPESHSRRAYAPLILYYSVSVYEKDIDHVFESQRETYFPDYEVQSLWLMRSGWPLTRLHVLRRKAIR